MNHPAYVRHSLDQRWVVPSNTARPFSLQYTALILIILTFVAGAFSSPPNPAELYQSEVLPSSEPQIIHPEYIAKIEYTDLFTPAGEELNEAAYAALSLMLRSHDLRAAIKLFLPQTVTDATEAKRTAVTVARGVTLYRKLIHDGVPPNAVVVWATSQNSDAQAQLTLTRSELRNND